MFFLLRTCKRTLNLSQPIDNSHEFYKRQSADQSIEFKAAGACIWFLLNMLTARGLTELSSIKSVVQAHSNFPINYKAKFNLFSLKCRGTPKGTHRMLVCGNTITAWENHLSELFTPSIRFQKKMSIPLSIRDKATTKFWKRNIFYGWNTNNSNQKYLSNAHCQLKIRPINKQRC